MIPGPAKYQASVGGAPAGLATGRMAHGHPGRWFIQLRWVAVGASFVLANVAVHGIEVLPAESWIPMMTVIATLAALNAAYTVLLNRSIAMDSLTAFQAYADLVLLTLLIHFSGGIENPLVLLTIFHVIIAGITLSRRHCFQVAGFATLLFAALAWGEASGFVEHYTLRLVPHYEEHGEIAHAALDSVFVLSSIGLQGGILILTAFFVTNLADRLRQREHQLELSVDLARTQRQLLERSLESTETGLFVCDASMEPVLSNGRWNVFAEQIGEDDALNQAFFGEQSLIHQTLEHGAILVNETSALTDDGIPQTFQATTAPLIDKDGQVTHVVQLVRDITWQKKAESRLIRAGQLAAVGELAGQVAHEVNNPIAIISAKARILLSDHSDTLSEKTESELHKIVDLSDRVAKIASGLLSYCRPSGAVRQPVDIRLPARRALSMIEQKALSSGIDCEDTMPEDLPWVVANEQEIEQVFLNLYLNSLDAMPSGGLLTIHAERVAPSDPDTPERVRVSVSDTGEGISEDVRSRVFEPFFTTKPEGKGTGLGLSICEGLIKHNGGTIDIRSGPGRGTTIVLELPVSGGGSSHG